MCHPVLYLGVWFFAFIPLTPPLFIFSQAANIFLNLDSLMQCFLPVSQLCMSTGIISSFNSETKLGAICIWGVSSED